MIFATDLLGYENKVVRVVHISSAKHLVLITVFS